MHLDYPNAQLSCQCDHFDMIWDYKRMNEKVQAFKTKRLSNSTLRNLCVIIIKDLEPDLNIGVKL